MFYENYSAAAGEEVHTRTRTRTRTQNPLTVPQWKGIACAKG